MNRNFWKFAAFAVLFAVPAQAATTDPEVILYRFAGVNDNGGGDSAAVATSFHCTNFSGVPETVRIVVRDGVGTVRSNVPGDIAHLATRIFSTHGTAMFAETILQTGPIPQGTAAIAATSINVVCTAMMLDASAAIPIGVALHGVRFNPIPATQE